METYEIFCCYALVRRVSCIWASS